MNAADAHLARWRQHSDREQLAPLSEPDPAPAVRTRDSAEARKRRLRDATPAPAYHVSHAQEL